MFLVFRFDFRYLVALSLFLVLIDCDLALAAKGHSKKKSPKSCRVAIARVASDLEGARGAPIILISNRDWWNHTHPFPPAVFDRLRKNHTRFIVMSNSSSDFEAPTEAEIKNRTYDPKTDLHIRSDEYTSGMGENWTRDFGPHTLIDNKGKRFLLFHQNDIEGDDHVNTNQSAFEAKVSEFTNLPVKHVRLIYQGGHLLPLQDGNLVVSRDVLRFNAQKTEKDFEKEFRSVGIKKITWIDPAPTEVTGHADIFIKDLGNKRILISETSPPQERGMRLGTPRAPIDEKALPAYLDNLAETFAAQGYEVHRLKNPPPGNSNDEVLLHYPYANSLIMGNLALVPSYNKKEWDLKAKNFYEEMGFEVLQVDMSSVVHSFGSVHCATCDIHVEE